MNRLTFIKNLIGLYGLAAFPADLAKEFHKVYLLQFFVRGFQFHEGPKILHQINKEGLVDLVREPDNKFDKNAIAIYFEGKKIGFVPMEDNVVLANIMDSNLLDLQAEITHIVPEAATWEQIAVAIYALKESVDDVPEHLRKVSQPEYYTLRKGENLYQRIYFYDEEIIDGEAFYQNMIDNSSNDRVYDLIHHTFETPGELEEAVNASKFVINKKRLGDFDINVLGEKINDSLLEIENVFDEDGYIVANINKIAEIPDEIERFVKIADKVGNVFYEVLLNATK